MGFSAGSRVIDRRGVWLGLLLGLLVAACSQDDRESSVGPFRVAVLPDQSEAQLRRKYHPLLEFFKLHTGLQFELLIPESYDQLVQWFADKRIDMARFGGASYVKASLQSNASPLVMRDVDGRFRSVALVHADNPANSLRDVEGASLAFGDRFSTSGHFMPRYFFQQENIIPENYFSKILYSGAHDRTAAWIRDGKVDMGLVNAVIVNEMFHDGRLRMEDVRIVWTSPTYANYVWAVQPELSKKRRTLIRDAFLHMSEHAGGKLLLKTLGGNYYIPAGQEDFDRLQQVILQMEQAGLVQ